MFVKTPCKNLQRKHNKKKANWIFLTVVVDYVVTNNYFSYEFRCFIHIYNYMLLHYNWYEKYEFQTH